MLQTENESAAARPPAAGELAKRRVPPRRERRSEAERRDRARFTYARVAVQLVVVAVVVWSIVGFHRFVVAVTSGAPGDLVRLRPPGFEAWTPIAALVSLVHWLRLGEWDHTHPAGLLIMLGAIATAFVLRGAFCGWICPVGTVNDWLARLGRRLRLRRDRPPPAWVDLPLRGLRWALFLFFLWGAVFLGEYYFHVFDRFADVGMYGYWAWGRVGWVFATLMVVSVLGGLVIDRFWCRYLCPYGALIQLFARLSPWRVRRDPDACTDCGKCDRACPALLKVSTSLAVTSSRCIGCGECVKACPEKRALLAELKAPGLRGRDVGWLATAALAVVLFFALPVLAQLTGNWQTSITTAEYRRVIPRMKAGTFDRRHVMTRAGGGSFQVVPGDAPSGAPAGHGRGPHSQ
jgi:ferredoxin